MMHRQLALIIAAVMAASASVATQQPTDAQPRFKASVEVTSIDVGVVDGQGKPLLNLAPEEFSVRVDGKARRVVSVEWVSLAAPAATERQIRARVPDGYSSNETSTGGRLVAIAVDEPHIRPGGAAAVLAAASAFIDRLSPSDRLAAVSLGIGGTATPFVADRERIKTAIGKMSGQWDVSKTSSVTVTASEAVEIADGNRLILDQAVSRECAGLRAGTSSFLQCRTEVETEAVELASQVTRAGSITIKGLRELLTSLQVLDGPKTLILMSEGFSVRDTALVNELGSLAAMTRTSIYAL
jgi:hypothetical protein